MPLSSVEDYGQFLDTLPDAALLVNRRGTIVFANTNTNALLGYEPSDLVGRPIRTLVSEEDDSERPERFARAIGTPPRARSTRLDVHARHRDGRDVWLDLTLAPHTVGRTPLTLCVLRDARMQGDGPALFESEAKYRELRVQQQQVQTLTALGAVLRETQTRSDVIRVLLEEMLTLLQANGTALVSRGRDDGTVLFEHGRGLLERWTNRRVAASEAVSSSVLADGVPFVTNSVADHPWLSRRGLPEAAKAYASIPMDAHGVVVGALVLTKPSPFLAQEIDTLLAVGEIAAIALQRAVLHERLIHESAAIEEAYEATVESWGRALDMRDRMTEGHTRRVTAMTMRLARQMGVPEERLQHIRRGAVLHDIGNMVVPDSILFKPGQLTDDERSIMRRHTEYAYDLLGPIEFLRPALEIPCFHHERWDGTGYPRGLKGDAIPLAARIFAVADAYDAITSDRPYARAASHDAALRAIAAHSGSHFDPDVVAALLALTRTH